MKTYDFSKGKRGPVLPVPPGKERITIRLDADILEYFRRRGARRGRQLSNLDQQRVARLISMAHGSLPSRKRCAG